MSDRIICTLAQESMVKSVNCSIIQLPIGVRCELQYYITIDPQRRVDDGNSFA